MYRYTAVLQALEDCGALGRLRRIGGSSVGAICAGLCAVGCSPQEIADVFSPNVKWLFHGKLPLAKEGRSFDPVLNTSKTFFPSVVVMGVWYRKESDAAGRVTCSKHGPDTGQRNGSVRASVPREPGPARRVAVRFSGQACCGQGVVSFPQAPDEVSPAN